MTKQEFNFLFTDKKHGIFSFELFEGVRVYRKPLEIYFNETEDVIEFKSIDELLNYKINGVTVWDIIESKDKLCPDEITLD